MSSINFWTLHKATFCKKLLQILIRMPFLQFIGLTGVTLWFLIQETSSLFPSLANQQLTLLKCTECFSALPSAFLQDQPLTYSNSEIIVKHISMLWLLFEQSQTGNKLELSVMECIQEHTATVSCLTNSSMSL